VSDCIEHTGCRTHDGYGRKTVRRKTYLAHRLVWAEVHGPIPEGMIIMHTCDNPPCINIDHLRLGTKAENTADMIAKGRQGRGYRRSNAKRTVRR